MREGSGVEMSLDPKLVARINLALAQTGERGRFASAFGLIEFIGLQG